MWGCNKYQVGDSKITDANLVEVFKLKFLSSHVNWDNRRFLKKKKNGLNIDTKFVNTKE